jgi:hypothetical protein
MNYTEFSEPFGEDDVVLVDSACNVLAINREQLFSNLDKRQNTEKSRLRKTNRLCMSKMLVTWDH